MLDRRHPIVEKKLGALRELLLRMGGLAEAILEKSLRALFERDAERAQEVKTDDLAIDRLDVEIDRAVLEMLALQAPVAQDLRQVIGIKTAALDLERVGDLARNIADSAIRLCETASVPLPSALAELAAGSRRVLASALTAFADFDAARARGVRDDDDRIDADEARVIRQTIEEMRKHPERSETGMELILVAKSLERVGDHATNIAEVVVMVEEAVNLKHAEKIGR